MFKRLLLHILTDMTFRQDIDVLESLLIIRDILINVMSKYLEMNFKLQCINNIIKILARQFVNSKQNTKNPALYLD